MFWGWKRQIFEGHVAGKDDLLELFRAREELLTLLSSAWSTFVSDGMQVNCRQWRNMMSDSMVELEVRRTVDRWEIWAMFEGLELTRRAS